MLLVRNPAKLRARSPRLHLVHVVPGIDIAGSTRRTGKRVLVSAASRTRPGTWRVGDSIKIQRLLQLDAVAAGVIQGLAPGIAVGVRGQGGIAEHIGVKGVAGMHMQVAERALRSALGAVAGSGFLCSPGTRHWLVAWLP